MRVIERYYHDNAVIFVSREADNGLTNINQINAGENDFDANKNDSNSCIVFMNM